MFRLLTVAFALFMFALTTGTVNAQEKKFFLEDDGSVTLREVAADVATLKSEVAALKAEVAAIKKSALPPLKSGKPIVNPATPSTVQFKTVRTQVCENGVCRIVNQLVPLTDLETAALAAGTFSSVGANPCPMGQCTDCQCASMSLTGLTGASFSTTSSGRTGWYLGKNLGRTKGGGSCASGNCGQ